VIGFEDSQKRIFEENIIIIQVGYYISVLLTSVKDSTLNIAYLYQMV